MVEETVVDNPPVFSQDSYIFQLAENVEDNYVIGSLGVTDESEWRLILLREAIPFLFLLYNHTFLLPKVISNCYI